MISEQLDKVYSNFSCRYMSWMFIPFLGWFLGLFHTIIWTYLCRFLTAEKNKREIKLAIAAKDILSLWTELNIRARNEREEHIESGNLDSFQLSNENMQWLEQMKQSLTVRFSSYFKNLFYLSP